MGFYKTIVRPVLFLFPPELIHHFTFFTLNSLTLFPGLIKNLSGNKSITNSNIRILGLVFPHHVGLAAGMDKNGIAIRPMKELGFAFLELGTVTPKAQKGNEKPRLFRLINDKALINRMGFNNHGVDALAERLSKKPEGIIIGGNIGKNTLTPNSRAVEDYAYCFEKLYGLVDYFVVNVSCPNLSDLRELQDKDSLREIMNRLMSIRSGKELVTPVLLKVSPDLNISQINDLIEVVKETGIDGIIATNTSVGRSNLKSGKSLIDKIGKGGLSGRPLSGKSTEIIEMLRKELPKPFPIIASGGIMSADDAEIKIKAGADLVQIYTGFVYEGPSLIRRIQKRLAI